MRQLQAMAGLVALALAGSAHVGGSRAAGTYSVHDGDTLARVARRTGVSILTLAKANNIADPNRVRAGQVLTIPKEGEPVPAKAGAPAPKVGEPAPAVPPLAPLAPLPPLPPLPSPYVVLGGGRTHHVANGQTLAAISRLYDTTVAELVQSNGLKNPNLIREGVDLAVPGPEWLCPVQGAHQFTDSWGQPREGGRRHLGVDVFAVRGTPVVADVGGTVEHSVGAVAGNGYYLKGDDGNTYYGAHLDTLGPAGRVERGGVIGTVGNTGNAKGTTPHLHFEIRPGGDASVNPYPTLQKWC